MRTDVVVVTWRGREVLASCLARLARQTAPCRVIVVDNGSADGTAELVRDRFPAVTLIELPANVGFGRAVDAGVRAGRGEALVLVNDDVDCEPGFVAAITAPLDDPAVGMVAGLLLQPGPGEVVDGFGIELDTTLAAYNRARHGAPGDATGVLAGPSGGAAAYRRTAYEAVGGFDARLFAYAEDLDLLLRLRLAGWAAAGAAGARGVHLGGATAGVDSPVQRRLAGFGRGFVLRRYGVLRSRAAARALLVEALVVGVGLVRHRTAIPLTARAAGWRAAGRGHLPVPAGAVDSRIGLREALRRLRSAR